MKLLSSSDTAFTSDKTDVSLKNVNGSGSARDADIKQHALIFTTSAISCSVSSQGVWAISQRFGGLCFPGVNKL